jgi:HEAT repeat protein
MRWFLIGLAGLSSWLLLGTPVVAQGDEPQVIGGKNLKQWIAETRSPDPGVRENALRTLPLFGKEARKASHALITELADQDTSLRVNAIIAIGQIGLDGENLEAGVKGLSKALMNDAQHINRMQAAVALGRLGTDAKAGVSALCSAVRDSFNSWETRRAAAIALRAVALEKDGPDPKAIYALVRGASDVCEKVRLEALMSLIYLGRPHQKADFESEKVGLERLIRDRDVLVSLWARVALMRIDKISETHVRVLGQTLRSTNLAHRLNAANALGMIGPEAKSQIPDLIEALGDKEETVIVAAMTALALMGDEASRAIPALQKLTESKNEVLRELAKQAIEQIKNGDKMKKAPPKKAVP